MNTRLLILLGLIATLAVSCKKDEATIPEPEKRDIMPLKIGNKWIYSCDIVDSLGSEKNKDHQFTDTFIVTGRVTRDMASANYPGYDILNKYDWYMVKGKQSSLGAMCNVNHNMVIRLRWLEGPVTIDTLVQDTEQEKEIFSEISNEFITAYRVGYGEIVNINEMPSKLNTRYVTMNFEKTELDRISYYYSRNIGISRYGFSYFDRFQQLTLKGYELK